MRVFTVFHPTPFCNLACRYCWAPEKNDGRRMPLAIVEQALAQIYGNGRVIKNDILWLTGEPLVMGLDYFKAAVSVCNEVKPHNLHPRFIVQTNGTLIDDEWARFFAEHDFVVGVTIDGPKRIHDANRVNKAGGGTFDATVRGIHNLIRRGVKGGALCVITRKTLELSPDELFAFFQEQGISWSYLLEAKIGENAKSDHALSLDDRPQLEHFLERLIKLWGDHPSSYIRDFDQLTRRLFSASQVAYDSNNLGCLDILNVSADGHFFWGNPELISATQGDLGAIRFKLDSDNVWSSRSTPAFQNVERQIHRGVDKCRNECAYFVSCQGGNPAHKFYEHKRFDVSTHVSCQLNDQLIASLMLERMERELQPL